jgi:hypothetical protein
MTSKSKPGLVPFDGRDALMVDVLAHGAFLNDGWARHSDSDGRTYGLKDIGGVQYKAETDWLANEVGTVTTERQTATFLAIVVTVSSGKPENDTVRLELQDSLLSAVKNMMIPGTPHPDRHPNSHIRAEDFDDE